MTPKEQAEEARRQERLRGERLRWEAAERKRLHLPEPKKADPPPILMKDGQS